MRTELHKGSGELGSGPDIHKPSLYSISITRLKERNWIQVLQFFSLWDSDFTCLETQYTCFSNIPLGGNVSLTPKQVFIQGKKLSLVASCFSSPELAKE